MVVDNKLIVLLLLLFGISCSKKIVPAAYQLTELENVKNITLLEGRSGLGPCEPSICISPINTKLILAGSVLDNVHFSKDGGLSWSNSKLKSSYGVFGDPVTIIDQKGKFYYAHLSNPKGRPYSSEEFLDRIVVQSSDDGIHFNDGSYPKGNQLKDQDKHWLAVNPHDNALLMSWTEFDKYGSKEDQDKSRILFSLSKDQGKTWSDALAISEIEGDCLDDDNTAEGAVPAVGIDGSFYVCWSIKNKIYLDISKDGGKTWLANDKIIADQPGGWSFDIPGITRCNGMPVIKVDHSNGNHRGRIYVSWADQRNGEDDTDVWIIWSDDNGNNWSKANRVNNDGIGKHQFFSWMTIDQSNGNIFLVFYDRRAYDDLQTDVYLASSDNGGQSFLNMRISEQPFTPTKQIFFGDYNDISAVNGVVRPIWTRMQDGVLSVHTAIINFDKKTK